MLRKIKGPTPIADKIDGQFCTNVAAKCASVLILGETYNLGIPNAIKIALVIGTVLFGGKAYIHAKKVER